MYKRRNLVSPKITELDPKLPDQIIATNIVIAQETHDANQLSFRNQLLSPNDLHSVCVPTVSTPQVHPSGLKADLGDCNRNAPYQIVASRGAESDHRLDLETVAGVGNTLQHVVSPRTEEPSLCSPPVEPLLHRLTAIGESRSGLEESSGRVTRRRRDGRTVDLEKEKTGSDGTVGPKSRLPPLTFFLGPRRFSIRSRDHFRRLKVVSGGQRQHRDSNISA
ncbi:hypothetical protein YC2023_086789 [Brassica napus]